MKIPPIQRQSMLSAYEKARTKNVQAQQPAMRSDAVEISANASGFSEALRKVLSEVGQETPQSRARVDTITRQVHSGEYNVSAEDVAASMLRGLKLNREA